MMGFRKTTLILFIFTCITVFPQASSNFSPRLLNLCGNWKSIPKGSSDKNSGMFSFSLDLDSAILFRKNHTVINTPKTPPGSIHEDILIVYYDQISAKEKAIYFDNEHHVINYDISYEKDNIIFTSTKVEGVPFFRLSYVFETPNSLCIKFEFSKDGVNYILYLEGKAERVS